MKKGIFLIAFAIMFSGNLFAQTSGNDYRSRNHKLNKHNKQLQQTEKLQLAESKVKIETDVNDYLARNQKFHKSEQEKNLFIRKDKIDTDYRAF